MHDNSTLINNSLPSRVFRNEPAVARLLGKLYGFNHISEKNVDRPKKKSPVPHTMLQPRWNNVHSKASNHDPHSTTFNKAKASAVIVPCFGERKSRIIKVLPIDTIPRRKSMDACNEVINNTAELNRNYRPPKSKCEHGNFVRKSLSYEEEKIRLNEVFGNSFNGVNDMTSLDCHATVRDDDVKRRQNSRLARISPDLISSLSIYKPPQKQDDSLRNQILCEIQDRQSFKQKLLESVDATRACDELIKKVDEEINMRLLELRVCP